MSVGGSPKFIRCSALKTGGLTGAMDQFASKWNCEELCIRYVSGPPNNPNCLPGPYETDVPACFLNRFQAPARMYMRTPFTCLLTQCRRPPQPQLSFLSATSADPPPSEIAGFPNSWQLGFRATCGSILCPQSARNRWQNTEPFLEIQIFSGSAVCESCLVS
jgi:hypothetical protein